jgi:hypothetical protein
MILARLALHVTLTETLAGSPHNEQPRTHNTEILRFLRQVLVQHANYERTVHQESVQKWLVFVASP